jgi:hypothetical protein
MIRNPGETVTSDTSAETRCRRSESHLLNPSRQPESRRLVTGALPPDPGPPSEMGDQDGHLLGQADRALPRNPQNVKGSLRSDLRTNPCRPGEPGAA